MNNSVTSKTAQKSRELNAKAKAAAKATKAAKAEVKKVATKAKPKAKAKQPSQYKVKVLEVNAALKKEQSSLNGAIKVLKALLKADAAQGEVLASLNAISYAKLKKATRKSKAGNYCPFYVLQAIYKLSK